MRKKIYVILSGNISTTPRALKSILFLKQDYDCEILCVNRNSIWADQDQDLIETHDLNVKMLELGRRPFLNWLYITLLHSFSKILVVFFKNNIHLNAAASNKASILLKNYISTKRFDEIDLVIGHSEGSLYPSWIIHRNWGVPFLFDVEDYHPGEQVSPIESKRREFIMKFILPKSSAISFASPLIKKMVFKLIGNFEMSEVILNSFNSTDFELPVAETNDRSNLKLLWFSQTIGYGRGLEELFVAISRIDSSIEIELTLIGHMDSDFNQNKILEFKKNIEDKNIELKVFEAIKQSDLHGMLADYDVGLALEFNVSNLNRQLCLTNKIITYAQAGLFILATDTAAQKKFIAEHPKFGKCIEQSPNSLTDAIADLYDHREDIRDNKIKRYDLAKGLSWESEQVKLKNLVDQLINPSN